MEIAPKYEEVIKDDTPVLLVKFRIDDNGREQYEWGLRGNIPIFPLISAIFKVEVALASTEMQRLQLLNRACKNQELVIGYVDNKFHWFLHKDTPDGMIGMLETVRTTLLHTNIVRQQANQQRILGVDGRPIH